ncbi:hypothetical protein WG8_3498, partial [Paenibacillus sp. Aloe-11]
TVKLAIQWTTAGLAEGCFAVSEHQGWVSGIYGSKTETPVLQGQAAFSGKAGILTVCLPEDSADHNEQLRLTECELDPARQRVELSYVFGVAAGTIVIDEATLEWKEHG